MKATELNLQENTTERIDEGPIDFARKVGAGVKGLAQGGFTGAATGYRSAKAGIEQQKLINNVAKNAAVEWAKIAQQLKAAGKPVRPIEAENWLKGFMRSVKPMSRPTSVAPAEIQKWLAKEVANYMATHSGALPPAGGEGAASTPGTPPGPGTVKPGTPPGPEGAGAAGTGGAGGAPAGGKIDPVYADWRILRQHWLAWTKSPEFKNLAEDPDLLNALKRVQARSTVRSESRVNNKSTLTEAQQIKLLESMPIYQGFYKLRRSLTEAELTQDQIKQIFQAVAKGAAEGGNVDMPGDAPADNRTWIGKAAGIADKWEEAKTKIQRLGGIAAMDAFFDKMQGGIIRKLGGDTSKTARAIEWYREVSKNSPILRAAVYAALLATAGWVAGGGVAAVGAAGAIRMIDSLLLGDKLSSSLYKGAKTAAITAGIGALKDYINTPKPGPAGVDPWATEPGFHDTVISDPWKTEPGFHDTVISDPWKTEPGFAPPTGGPTAPYTVQSGDNLSTLAQKFNVSTDQMLKANPSITNPDVLKAGQTINIPQPTGSDVYAGGVGTAADTQAKIASGAYTPSEISTRAAERAGIRESIIDYDKVRRTFMIQESLNLPQVSAVYLTQYGVQRIFESVSNLEEAGIGTKIVGAAKAAWDDAKNKVTYNRLELSWRRGGNETKGPVDSAELVKFLNSQGVKNGLISKVFGDMGIPTDGLLTPSSIPDPDATPAPGPGETPPAPGPGETPPAPGPGETPPAPGPAPKPGEPEAGGTGRDNPFPIFSDPYEFEEGFYEFLKAGGKITPPWINVLNDIIAKGMKLPSKPEAGEEGSSKGGGTGPGGVTINVSGGSATGGAGGSATGGTATADAQAKAAAAAAAGGTGTETTASSGTPASPAASPAAPKRAKTGGRVAGAPLSDTENARRKREARAVKRAGSGAPATATATAESFDSAQSTLFNKLMEMQLEQDDMAQTIASTAAQPTMGQKILAKTQQIGGKDGAVQQKLTGLAGQVGTVSNIIRQSSGAPGLRSFADAAKNTSQPKQPGEQQPQAQTQVSGTQIAVPAVGNVPGKKFTLSGNTYVDSSGKPVDPALNQLLMAINYGKVQRS